jgi:predicted regulator of Ras-like GTPase activity (Roadblock/LC7/MglB family)
MSDLAAVLESFCHLEGVRGALMVSPDGLVLEHVVNQSCDIDSIAVKVADGVRLGARTSHALGLEGLTQSYTEYLDLSVTSETLASGALLVILAEPKPNLGRIRLEIRKNRKIIEGLGS